MITLRERIKAALHEDDRCPRLRQPYRDIEFANVARDLLPLVLAEMECLEKSLNDEAALLLKLRADLAAATADLNDQRDEHIKAEALRAELAAMTAKRDAMRKALEKIARTNSGIPGAQARDALWPKPEGT